MAGNPNDPMQRNGVVASVLDRVPSSTLSRISRSLRWLPAHMPIRQVLVYPAFTPIARVAFAEVARCKHRPGKLHRDAFSPANVSFADLTDIQTLPKSLGVDRPEAVRMSRKRKSPFVLSQWATEKEQAKGFEPSTFSLGSCDLEAGTERTGNASGADSVTLTVNLTENLSQFPGRIGNGGRKMGGRPQRPPGRPSYCFSTHPKPRHDHRGATLSHDPWAALW